VSSTEMRQTRLAENQTLYRYINEQIEGLSQQFGQPVGVTVDPAWLCECADVECMESIEATLDEYETVRSNPRRFIVCTGHVFPEVERVVEENDRYTVVEKFGAGGAVAAALDPRKDSA
jgi:5-bromo-4-chloroindolyl phosphate hydrolysis protein